MPEEKDKTTAKTRAVKSTTKAKSSAKPKAETAKKADSRAKTTSRAASKAKPSAEKKVSAKLAEAPGAKVEAKLAAKPKAKSADIKVTLIRSGIGKPKDQKATIVGLGFKRLNQTVLLKDTPSVRGMIRKISHLVKVD